jgi:hypothetical protein
MKTPSRTFIVIVVALIATSSVVVFQGCSKGSGQVSENQRFTLEIGKDKDDFVPYTDKNTFDCALEALGAGNYEIRHKPHDGDTPDENYQPTCHHNTSLKTDSIITSALAKNEPIGDPNVTKKVQSKKVTDIKNVLDALQ